MKQYTKTLDYKGWEISTGVCLDTNFTYLNSTFIITRVRDFPLKNAHEWAEARVVTQMIETIIKQQQQLAMEYVDKFEELTPEEQILLNLGFSLSPDSTTI